MDDVEEDKTLGNIELAIKGNDEEKQSKDKVYAIWQTSAQGEASSWVAPDGVSEDAVWTDSGTDVSDLKEMTGDNAGYIIGLPAGDYLIVETGTVPDYHAAAADIPVTICADGSVKFTGTENGGSDKIEGSSISDNGDTITVVDPVVRGHFEIAKYLAADELNGSETPFVGVGFELYRVAENGEFQDTLIADGIVTGANGRWTSKDANKISFKEGTMPTYTYADGTEVSYYSTLSDGLPYGNYYLKEVSIPEGADAVLPQGDDAIKQFSIDQWNHKTIKELKITNSRFDATVTVPKIDAQTNEAIAGATFMLEFWENAESVPTDGTSASITYSSITSTESGLTLSSLKKGAYRLTEVSNDGYVVDSEKPFTATFVIKAEHAGKTFDLTESECRDAIGFTLGEGVAFDSNKGIPNDRVATGGGAKLLKVDGDGEDAKELKGAKFELQMLVSEGDEATDEDDEWVKVIGGLTTGTSYVLNDANDEVTLSSASATEGLLQVKHLRWGTYRFVETTPAPGYHAHVTDGDKQGSVTASVEFTIDKPGSDANIEIKDLGTIVNDQNEFVLQKQNLSGEPLADATFQIVPEQGSVFADDTTEAKPLTTGEDGTFSLDGMLVVGNTYTLTETVAPHGYALIYGGLTFTVQPNGTLDVTSGSNDYVVNGTTITATDYRYVPPTPGDEDDPAAFNLRKTGPDGAALAGAEFTLKPVGSSTFADKSTTPKTFTTAADGTFSLGAQLLTGGIYELKETKAPEGFGLIPGSLLFTVRDDGTLEKSGTADSGYSISGSTVTAVDPVVVPDPDDQDPDNPDPDNPDPDNPDPDNPDPDTPGDPDNPNPDNPNDPDTPNPDTPADPDTPNDPDTPTPNNPATPTTPTTPNKSTTSTPAKTTTTVKKTTPSKGASVVAMAKTGDSLAMAALGSGISALVAAALAIAVLTVRKRREH